MLMRIFLMGVLSFGISFANGFEVGSHVKIIKKDGIVVGVIKKVRSASVFECYDSSRHTFKVPVTQVLRVTPKRGMKFSNITGSYKHKVVELGLINGESTYCGVIKNITIDVSKNDSTSTRPFTITDFKYSSVEIMNKGAKASKGIVIELLDGQRIVVPVAKEDVKSIIFE